MAPNDSGSITDQLATQVRELLQGAEEQARKVMEDAETEVRRIRASASEQGHELIEQARKALDDLEGRLGSGQPSSAPTPVEPEPEPAVPDPVPESPSPAPGGDESAARLVAMKMALDGTPRDDVRSKLAADYSVADLDGLLDDVFAKAGR